jgi:alcohol dehydrogenase class IV
VLHSLAMPTTRPRYSITGTDALEHALTAALQRWPELAGDRAAALRRIIEAGSDVVEGQASAAAAERRRALRAVAGVASGVYEPDDIARLREEWPA